MRALLSCLLLCPFVTAQGGNQDELVWTDARELTVEGQGWQDTAAPWDRLPARAEKTVRKAVWDLSRQSSGIAVRFVAATPRLVARWTVTSTRLAMPHMPAASVSGLDLYARDADGRWRWVSATRPNKTTNTANLFRSVPVAEREYLLYLPLYNGTKQLEIGVPEGVALKRGPERPAGRRKPIVFYGTSITHGASASRPGMTHPAILGRRFDRPILNLGFSGNGRMEQAVADLLVELDPVVYVVDCLPNINAKAVTARTRPARRDAAQGAARHADPARRGPQLYEQLVPAPAAAAQRDEPDRAARGVRADAGGRHRRAALPRGAQAAGR